MLYRRLAFNIAGTHDEDGSLNPQSLLYTIGRAPSTVNGSSSASEPRGPRSKTRHPRSKNRHPRSATRPLCQGRAVHVRRPASHVQRRAIQVRTSVVHSRRCAGHSENSALPAERRAVTVLRRPVASGSCPIRSHRRLGRAMTSPGTIYRPGGQTQTRSIRLKRRAVLVRRGIGSINRRLVQV